ncbi:hypothetical protein ACXNSR_34695 [Streptomyces sp. NC-S4]
MSGPRPTGFQADATVVPTSVGRGDRVFCDKLNHAGIIDGCRLVEARGAHVRHFGHNDTEDLRSGEVLAAFVDEPPGGSSGSSRADRTSTPHTSPGTAYFKEPAASYVPADRAAWRSASRQDPV